MHLFKLYLYPFSLLYGTAAYLRNRFYDLNFCSSKKFNLPIIGIGNLRVGGTGKTPHVEYFIKLLYEKYTLAVLSRGYKRKTKGCIIASSESTPQSLGDESMQLYKKFKKKITITVSECRAKAIPLILLEKPTPQVVLLDDAFQHRSIRIGLNIVLTEHAFPFYEDNILPYGRLRESRDEIKRADLVVVSKCPKFLPKKEKETIVRRINKYTKKDTPIFFSKIIYKPPVPLFGKKIVFSNSIVLLTGISNDNLLKVYLQKNFRIVRHIRYIDHVHYTLKRIRYIVATCKSHFCSTLVTTEKDAVKLDNFKFYLKDLQISYVPIGIGFLEDELRLKKEIFDCIEKYKR